jgi:hypothetical protein
MNTSRFINSPTAGILPGGHIEPTVEQDGDEQNRKDIIKRAVRNASGMDLWDLENISARKRGQFGDSENAEALNAASIVIPILDKIDQEDGSVVWAPPTAHYAYLPAIFHAIQMDQKTGEPEFSDLNGDYEKLVRYFYELPVNFYLKDAPGVVYMLLASLGIPNYEPPDRPLTYEESIANAHRFSAAASDVVREVLGGLFRAMYKEEGSKIAILGRRSLYRERSTQLLSPVLGLNTVAEKTFRKFFPEIAQAFPLNGERTAQGMLGNENEAARKLRKPRDFSNRYTMLIEREKGALIRRVNSILAYDSDSYSILDTHLDTSPVVRDLVRNIQSTEILSILRQMLFVLESRQRFKNAIITN